MAALLGLTAISELLLAPTRTWQQIAVLLYLLPFVTTAWYCHWAQHDRLRDVILVFSWALAIALLSSPLVEIASQSPLPLVDRNLAKLDLVQTAAVVNWLHRHRALTHASAIAYWSLLPLLVAALLLPALCNYRKAAHRLIVAGTLAALLTGMLFAIWPAAGPWTVEGYQANKEQALVSSELLMLKAHHSRPTSRLQTDAIVSFPSFHTILAILSAIALWEVRRVRWLGLAICVAVSISTVTTGWHYTVDVLGGIVVAFTSYLAAARLVR